ncbi:hypothetical protein CDL15_Pgr002973 [Punica granatum]|uniref:General negative regulator of transcription subunit 3 n=1 Tax=Punica granatum TaxID=22663 RepID=A0A218X357_PUNGR|nr:hypothetical protein CDL15_Pgr002973 [Punica granatum]
MGASRKLQGEIDRVLKKVQEGVDVFDSIWNKVYDTENANQKEKFEADLKKEIKKLQRYRDQIKTWIQSSEIKDKKVSASYEQALVDARKLIEREMERFKICEKETKTKAFSKEGLGQQPKTDPKEKAKSETRDWINNVVGELETQIDIFEAEIEGLSVKKGKTRPPRLVHLETSIARHKAHIMKMELILRLLDNDELSPEQVNDVKDFLDDYVERNQEDFDEFSDVDELYSSLPLEKVESLEELVTMGPSSLLKATSTTSHQQSTSVQEQAEEPSSQDANPDTNTITGTPPAKSSTIGSAATTPTGGRSTSILSNAPANTSGAPTTLTTSVHAILENAGAANSSSTANLSTSSKEEENVNLPGRKPSPSLTDCAIARGLGRGALSSQPSASAPLTSIGALPSNGGLVSVPSASDIKRNVLGADDKLGGGGMAQPLVSPLSNRMILPQAAKAADGTGSVDSGNSGDNVAIAGRVFSPPMVSGIQWRSGSSFNQNEAGQLRGRAEIAPDQREKFLQRLQQVQQQGHSSLLGMQSLAGGKQFSASQQIPLLQQFNSQSSSGLGLGLQAPGLNTGSAGHLQQFGQQALMAAAPKDSEAVHEKVDEPQEEQIIADDSTAESGTSLGVGKITMNEDDMKSPHSVDAPAGVSGEPTQIPRDTDLSPGQPFQSMQSSGSLGVIGRRSVADLGAIGDNLGGPTVTAGPMHDQLYNLQMLEAAYHKLPQPKDSERARSYIPKHPVATPSSYPQVQAPIVNNPAFWERLGMEPYGADTLFFAFYYQQNTYQQYLAAKELKKQSWRFHKKYNTWFQRHEEPKVTTDEYEQGTYVYFDFHIANDDLQHGWCQRIKTEFTFEYNYLEDELMA